MNITNLLSIIKLFFLNEIYWVDTYLPEYDSQMVYANKNGTILISATGIINLFVTINSAHLKKNARPNQKKIAI